MRSGNFANSGDVMSDDDLEYYIKFPSPTLKDSSPTNETEEFVFVYDEDKLPVVMLLGWAGCQDKYLAKYSAIYEERGCITVRYTAPVECLFWRRSHMRVLGRRLVELISDMSLEEHPIFFHVFSNGGAFLYQHVSQAMQSQDKPLKVKGCIFDSAPGERRVSSLFRAIAAIVGGHWLYSTAVAAVATLACLVVWWLESLARSLRERKALDAEPIHLEEEPFRWPQLLVYSSRDRLICYKDVEKFAQHRRERGVAVTAVRFEDSPHVQHFLVHRDVYISSVCGFLHACLAPEDPGLPGAGRPN
ncbi:transmembrane protein 53 [Bacillus rossius redtenbacheri]|uniref:transmembrane protein 53 n=1 Tax=Bacillus rossius redtenbacheri TaxID=93214 RepID=UPI002FDD21EF